MMDRSPHPTHGMILVLALVTAGALAACSGGATSAPAGGATPGPVAATDAPPPAVTIAPAGPAAVRIAGFAFDPANLTVTAGSTVTWTNEDDAAHTVAWADGTAASGSLVKGGAPFSRTFDTPGTFAYFCGIHPAMKGSVTVEP